MEEKYEKVKEVLRKYSQEQLLVCYEKMSIKDKEKLLNQILEIDFEKMKDLYQMVLDGVHVQESKIEPIDYVDKSKLEQQEQKQYEQMGEEFIKAGKLAAVTMAGGQGTRLGYNGPKGTFDIGLESHKTLFELLCDGLKEAHEKYGVFIDWYIMTSHENTKQTQDFFAENQYLDYPKEKIHFFLQGELPMMGEDGKILVGEDGLVKLAADGHGGVFESMLRSGIIEDMQEKQIEWIFIAGVDNPLANMVDPVLMGLAQTKNCLAAGKSVVKANPEENVGVFCIRDGKPSVIEYTEITKEMAYQKNEKGELAYGESHIICNLFNIKRVELIAKNKLPYHSAHKKAKYMNREGELVTPEKPNAYKFESFIFDAFSSLDSMAIMRVKREDEFAPVKNASGTDSPETARELYKQFHEIN